MDPETKPSDSITLTMDQLKELVTEATKIAVAPFEKRVVELQEQVAKSSSATFAENVPNYLRSTDPLVNPANDRFGRRVTIATRPVQENPDQYEHVVDPGSVGHTTLTDLIAKINESNGTS